jgi:hypothetical protein
VWCIKDINQAKKEIAKLAKSEIQTQVIIQLADLGIAMVLAIAHKIWLQK